MSWVLTAGNIDDTTMMTAVLEGIPVPRPGKGRPRTRPERVLADKGYPSKANRARLRERGIAATTATTPQTAATSPPMHRRRQRASSVRDRRSQVLMGGGDSPGDTTRGMTGRGRGLIQRLRCPSPCRGGARCGVRGPHVWRA
ncbi:transposase [Streptomyces shenzhenensis]